MLATATRSAVLTIGKSKTTIPLTASSPGCSPVSQGLQCSVNIQAPAGKHTYSAVTYTNVNGTGTQLASASGPITIYGGSNGLNLDLAGIAQRYAVTLSPSSIPGGYATGVPVIVYGFDATGKPIPSVYLTGALGGGYVYFNYSGFAKGSIRSSRGCCGAVATFGYNGVQSGQETFTVSNQSATVSPGKLIVTAPSQQQATLLVAIGVPPNANSANVVEFGAGATGNQRPVRSIVPGIIGVGRCLCEDTSGNFWLGWTEYSNAGQVLEKLLLPRSSVLAAIDSAGHPYVIDSSLLSSRICIVNEYAAGVSAPARIRQITIPNCFSARSMAVDYQGNILVMVYPTNGPSLYLYEYAPGTSNGNVAPSRSVLIPNGSTNSQVDVDAAGNVYALSIPTLLYKIPPTGTSTQQIAAGYDIQSVAVDDAGDVYIASDPGTSGPVSIYEFAPGGSTPERTITGSNTMLPARPLPGLVAVPRQR